MWVIFWRKRALAEWCGQPDHCFTVPESTFGMLLEVTLRGSTPLPGSTVIENISVGRTEFAVASIDQQPHFKNEGPRIFPRYTGILRLAVSHNSTGVIGLCSCFGINTCACQNETREKEKKKLKILRINQVAIMHNLELSSVKAICKNAQDAFKRLKYLAHSSSEKRVG
ncbi:hypothetical protein AVEN_89228-1 [Araneus ventricosus]|uniref:Uncharacterized protein n=1 Tax=Araneus ventricosus TaxID=182803 RepID=A0A4Y2L2S6_ARAVE|nr:hypothetical protein AVEN_89228-1 [Araneus ventricosus]